MSQANVEIVRRAHQALNGGGMDALVVLCDVDFRLDMSDRVFNPAVYTGHDGIWRFYSEVRDVWATYVWEPEELMEAGDNVVALLRPAVGAAAAGSKSSTERRWSGPCGNDEQRPCAFSGTAMRPSKPWGCGTSRA